ncbi:hypothetical protein PROPEN_03320 [Proteus penneri ATCC 35198]|nr:hypothetical protein PROPEN_03320 [Proteus penneri ATCC 35198]
MAYFHHFYSRLGLFLIRQLVMIYNNMVMLKNNCYKAFANIDVLLKNKLICSQC